MPHDEISKVGRARLLRPRLSGSVGLLTPASLRHRVNIFFDLYFSLSHAASIYPHAHAPVCLYRPEQRIDHAGLGGFRANHPLAHLADGLQGAARPRRVAA